MGLSGTAMVAVLGVARWRSAVLLSISTLLRRSSRPICEVQNLYLQRRRKERAINHWTVVRCNDVWKANMKNKLAVGLVLIVVVVVGIAATQQSKDIPPGVPAERWIALNDSLGFVVGEGQPDWETGKN